MSESARSITAVLSNKTDATLERRHCTLDHGAWTNFPPEKIQPHGSGSWLTESDGFMTGTEGKISYTIVMEKAGGQKETLGQVTLHWDNPYAGSNSFDATVTANAYEAVHTGGSGFNATVEWTFQVKV